MKPAYTDPLVELYEGDCLEVLRAMPSESVDSVVTDPPAGIHFMSKDWDHDKGGRTAWVAWMTQVMVECHRVLKPGGHAVVWALPRTSHWTALALEDARFEIRDCMTHIFASGFPKSLNLPGGWGTALKPASEHWWLARKPLVGSVAQNVTRYGTGALNIDGSRIGTEQRTSRGMSSLGVMHDDDWKPGDVTTTATGRWPSNVMLSDPELFDEPNPYVVGSGAETAVLGHYRDPERVVDQHSTFVGDNKIKVADRAKYAGDSGGYSRFFLIPKADRAERERGLAGREVERPNGNKWSDQDYRTEWSDGVERKGGNRSRANVHPTVKPIDLMRHLVKLVTPPGGTCLDPFLGSGTTALAASELGIKCIGVEREAEYLEIAKGRLMATPMGLGLDVPAATPRKKPSTSHWPARRTPHKSEGWGFSSGQEGLVERYDKPEEAA